MGQTIDSSLPARIGLDDPRGCFAQQYRRLAIRLRDLARGRQARSIVVTSAQAGEGKTTTASNLAIALATTDHDEKVVLVDLDLHRASIASSLDIQVDTSVEAVIRGESPLSQAIMETDVYGLFIVAANRPARQPDELLAHDTLSALISELESRFDWVVINTPPILAASDAQLILQHAAAALLVVRAGISPVLALQKALDDLPKGKVLGSFLNASPTKVQRYGDYYGPPPRDPEPASLENDEETVKADEKRN